MHIYFNFGLLYWSLCLHCIFHKTFLCLIILVVLLCTSHCLKLSEMCEYWIRTVVVAVMLVLLLLLFKVWGVPLSVLLAVWISVCLTYCGQCHTSMCEMPETACGCISRKEDDYLIAVFHFNVVSFTRISWMYSTLKTDDTSFVVFVKFLLL